MTINLLVIRTDDPKKLAEFYGLLGIAFEYHKHGQSPYHYSAKIGDTVLEIYPLTKNQTTPDKNLRLGFEVDDFEGTIQRLKETNTPFLSEPLETEFGLMAAVMDPDSRKIEVYKKD